MYFYLLFARDGLNLVFSRNMDQRYTAEEACEAIINDDNFDELESTDSLDEASLILLAPVLKSIPILIIIIVVEP